MGEMRVGRGPGFDPHLIDHNAVSSIHVAMDFIPGFHDHGPTGTSPHEGQYRRPGFPTYLHASAIISAAYHVRKDRYMTTTASGHTTQSERTQMGELSSRFIDALSKLGQLEKRSLASGLPDVDEEEATESKSSSRFPRFSPVKLALRKS